MGLITSGPISSGPLNSSGAPRKGSGPLDSHVSMKHHTTSIVHNQAVTKLGQEDEYSFQKSFPKMILWAMGLLFVMGFIAGGFILGAVHNPILLIVVVVLLVLLERFSHVILYGEGGLLRALSVNTQMPRFERQEMVNL